MTNAYNNAVACGIHSVRSSQSNNEQTCIARQAEVSQDDKDEKDGPSARSSNDDFLTVASMTGYAVSCHHLPSTPAGMDG